MVMLDTLLARDGVSHECASCCRKRAEGQKEAEREAGRHQDLREGIRKEIITDHKIASVEDVGMMWGNGGAEKRRRRGGEEEESSGQGERRREEEPVSKERGGQELCGRARPCKRRPRQLACRWRHSSCVTGGLPRQAASNNTTRSPSTSK